MAGENLRTDPPQIRRHAAGVLPPCLGGNLGAAVPPEVVDLYSRMVREAGALFGACHYPEFHFLVTCSDDLGHLGLEHLTSSLNGVRERDLIDEASRKGWICQPHSPRICPFLVRQVPQAHGSVHARLPHADEDLAALGLRRADGVPRRGAYGP